MEALRRALAQCQHITGVGQSRFMSEDLDGQVLRLAGERLIITVQAALDDLSMPFLDANADLPFHLVRGMRNRLAHGYDDIDPAIVWATLAGRLPDFIVEVTRRLEVQS
ncbi:HepT-like ribonuclease domain-containing protein [Luteipulveratus mongoliensis]|uniref:HepT-like ribonuclease domain-containing protein n=1 Tax=Luteipulveratus mongoliensis TaxID=571913 RepID=UPI00316AE155